MPELQALLKKKFWHRCFAVNFAKFLRTPFSQDTSGRLLLKGPFQILFVILLKTISDHIKAGLKLFVALKTFQIRVRRF